MANTQLTPAILELILLVAEFAPNGFTVTIRAGDVESCFAGTK